MARRMPKACLKAYVLVSLGSCILLRFLSLQTPAGAMRKGAELCIYTVCAGVGTVARLKSASAPIVEGKLPGVVEDCVPRVITPLRAVISGYLQCPDAKAARYNEHPLLLPLSAQ